MSVHSALLAITSFIGSLVGFYVCYRTLITLEQVAETARMRICMMNTMALAFIFAMFVELATGSKSLAVLVPFISVCVPMVWGMKEFGILEIGEIGITSLMSISMSVMLLGMVNNRVVWLIQMCLLLVEMLLFFAVTNVFPRE
ncbi:hypothetical protein [Alicyclobacillus fodiniaquatilis]|uniref:EamA domain-containing protein n=1 Tax=Alicyclobacillus fodiniaquatilis TaxID=1661150 RepID=A0ABW4JGD0_9BACL